ncbi:hypothetical protein ACN27G_11405 [Plantactinospora sp. WMMB334]|uniref:hypothetical protein n=1 Tax=Plantactinospora sp. WMMB334 TaxID=3404119 RepID=UPI003B95DB33
MSRAALDADGTVLDDAAGAGAQRLGVAEFARRVEAGAVNDIAERRAPGTKGAVP